MNDGTEQQPMVAEEEGDADRGRLADQQQQPQQQQQQKDEEEPDQQMNAREIERLEEAKLRAKYPIPSMLGGAGGGAGMGMAGANATGPPAPGTGEFARPIGGHSAFLQKRLAKGQKFFDSGDYQMAKQKLGPVGGAAGRQPLKVPAALNPYATGDTIPTPDTVPTRKTSIIQSSKFPPPSAGAS